jgi:TolB-like protein
MKSRAFASLKRFGVFEFDSTTGELRKHGLRIKISGQTARLLTFLVEDPGTIRTRAEIRQNLWPDKTFADFEQNLNKAVFALRAALCDSATNPRFIETLVGQGYRFIPFPQVASPPVVNTRLSRRIESVAVLPFVNGIDTPETEFLGHQIALNLIDALSRLPGLRVLAYSTVKHYRQQEADPMVAGSNLGVRGVVAGEFIRRVNDVLLHLELIDVSDGTQLWGAQVKCAAPVVLEQSEAIAEEVTRQLSPVVGRGKARARPKLIEPFSAAVPGPDRFPESQQSTPAKLLKRLTGS